MTSSTLLPLPSAAEAALDRAVRRWRVCFGEGSRAELSQTARCVLASPEADRLDDVCLALERSHVFKYGASALSAELADERARDSAATDDDALVGYEKAWMERLRRLQRARAAAWYVRGLSDAEVRDALSLRLLELLRGPRDALATYSRAGQAWGLVVMQRELTALRKTFRLRTALVDVPEAGVPSRAPGLEERWMEAEADAKRALASKNAEQTLSRPQRRWLLALNAAAERGEFFRASDALNLSAAARLIGKDRASALRAFKELQTRFQHELERLAREDAMGSR